MSVLGAACRSHPPPQPETSDFVGPALASDWSAFGRSFAGRLVRPGEPGYNRDRELFDPRFDVVHPAAIAFCRSAADVQQSIRFARQHGLAFAARSGGHSYAGYSTTDGLVCDVKGLSTITVDTGVKRATVGAGAHLIDVYATLAQHGMVLPGGSCPTVGIAGLTLGGGQGVLGRKFGMTSDNLRSLRIVTAAGDLLTCDPQHNADLFWACRGGGGGNFGVVTSFTFDVHPVASLARFYLEWPWGAAHAVLAGWQGWAPHAPDPLWSNCHLRAGAGQPAVSVSGVYVGSKSALEAQLPHLVQSVGSQPATREVSAEGVLDTMLLEAGCSDLTVAQCHLPTQNPAGVLARQISKAKSDFFGHPLPAAGIQAVIEAIEARLDDPHLQTGAGVGFDAYGGAINRVAPAATAFVHRDSLFLAQYSTRWSTTSSPATVHANTAWLTDFAKSMRPFANGEAYQNYIDPGRADWEQAYYGSNLQRLRKVKAKYDPHAFFEFAQSVPPA
jgi:FAD/FMN-containing dehydrogenase